MSLTRRSFLRAIATVGTAAAIPSALLPLWKQRERLQYLSFRGRPVIYSKYCPKDTIYFLSPHGIMFNDGAGWRAAGMNAVVMNPATPRLS